MAVVQTQRVDGSAELKKAFADLKTNAAKKVMKKAITAGAKVVNKSAKRTAPVGRGTLKKSIGQKVQVYRGSGTVVAIIGPRKGFETVNDAGRKIDPVKYAHIAERGRKAVFARRKKALSDGRRFFGKHVRAWAGKPFVGPAIRAPEVLAAVEASAAESLRNGR